MNMASPAALPEASPGGPNADQPGPAESPKHWPRDPAPWPGDEPTAARQTLTRASADDGADRDEWEEPAKRRRSGSPRAGRRPPGRRGRGRRWRARAAGRAARGVVSREALLAEGHPLAPSNTTDFLIDDHDYRPDGDVVFDRYGQPTPRVSPLAAADWDPVRQAVTAVSVPPWRLQPSVSLLVGEHIEMERHIEELEARIAVVRQRRHSSDDASDEEMQQGEVRMSPETAAKIRVLEAEIRRLEEENAELRAGNERLVARGCGDSLDSYTSDSESDSSTTSSASSGSSRSSSSSSGDSSSSNSGSASPAPASPRPPASV